MKCNGFKRIVVFCLTVFFCVSTGLCLAVSPWKVFDDVKDIGKQYNSTCIEKLSAEIDSKMKGLRRSLLYSAPERIDRFYSQAWNLLVHSLNKYSNEIKKENETMYSRLIGLINPKK